MSFHRVVYGHGVANSENNNAFALKEQKLETAGRISKVLAASGRGRYQRRMFIYSIGIINTRPGAARLVKKTVNI